ncbi:MAG TPA: excisionase family DNA-binding protein [Rubrivivax sp.]|jgi:excisionase family DNA binding protein|nr:excisionase family DNA-binding protein [Rubrivivax sp.]
MPKPQSSLKADPLGQLASGLASRLARKTAIDSRTILRALHETLDGADEASRSARLSAQLHLASVADSLMGARAPAPVDRMLSTVEAAEIMACSRPYVAMLIDSGKLTGATKTSGGHRKVSLASVEAWLASREPSADKDYREAGKAAGIYGVEEAVAMKAARREPVRTRG